MQPTWFERLKSRLVMLTSSEEIEFETARQVACVNERLQNNLLVRTSEPFAPSEQAPLDRRAEPRPAYASHV